MGGVLLLTLEVGGSLSWFSGWGLQYKLLSVILVSSDSWSWQESSEDIWGRIKRCDPCWKRLGSTDEKGGVIYKLVWI